MTNEPTSQDSKVEIATKVELDQKPTKVSSGIKPTEADFVSKNRTKLEFAFSVYDQRCKDIKNKIGKTKDVIDVISLKNELNSILKELSDLQFRYGKLGRMAGLRILNLRSDTSRSKEERVKSGGIIEPAVISVIKTIDTPDGTLILYSDKTHTLIPKHNPISTTDSQGDVLTTQNREDTL